MGRARDARIVVPDGLLATPRQIRVGQVRALCGETPQVLLDRLLVLGRGGHYARVADRALRIEGIAVVEDAARRLRAPVAAPGPRHDRNGRLLGGLVGLDDAKGLLAGVERL